MAAPCEPGIGAHRSPVRLDWRAETGVEQRAKSSGTFGGSYTTKEGQLTWVGSNQRDQKTPFMLPTRYPGAIEWQLESPWVAECRSTQQRSELFVWPPNIAPGTYFVQAAEQNPAHIEGWRLSEVEEIYITPYGLADRYLLDW